MVSGSVSQQKNVNMMVPPGPPGVPLFSVLASMLVSLVLVLACFGGFGIGFGSNGKGFGAGFDGFGAGLGILVFASMVLVLVPMVSRWCRRCRCRIQFATGVYMEVSRLWCPQSPKKRCPKPGGIWGSARVPQPNKCSQLSFLPSILDVQHTKSTQVDEPD